MRRALPQLLPHYRAGRSGRHTSDPSTPLGSAAGPPAEIMRRRRWPPTSTAPATTTIPRRTYAAGSGAPVRTARRGYPAGGSCLHHLQDVAGHRLVILLARQLPEDGLQGRLVHRLAQVFD